MTTHTPCDIVAVILAAGRGTRMGKLTQTLPKPLVPVLGRAALQWVVDGLVASGIKRFVVVTGYLSEQVREVMTDYRADEIEIAFVEQDRQLGTAHALLLTEDAVGNAPVFLAFADIMTSAANFESVIRQFRKCQCDLTAGIRDIGDPWSGAAVYTDADMNILRIIEKPPPGTSTTTFGHAGMYCFANKIYHYLKKVAPSARGEYEVTDAVSAMITDGLLAQAVELHGYWKDLATPEDIIEAETLMKQRLEPPKT